MKLKMLFLCVLFTQTSASFFDEFRGAMSTVENGFGRLFSDVVTDVRETIGCTILAVKQVLSLGDVSQESSEYNRRCRGANGEDTSTYVKKSETFIMPPSTSKSETKKPISEQIEESDFVGKSSAYNIDRERERLSDITVLLRRELGGISEEIKRELSKIETNSNHPTVDGIWSDIKALHEIELNHKNTPVATEIDHILNEIVGILHGDETQTGIPVLNTESPVEDPSNKAFSEIESQFERIEQEHEESNFTVTSFEPPIEAAPLISDHAKSDQVPSSGFPMPFKGVAKNIMDETSRTFRLTDRPSQEYEHVAPTTTEKSITTEKFDDYFEMSPDYKSFFQLAPKDSPARLQAAQEATSLIEKSRKTDAIMNDYFRKADKVGTSVFGDADLSEFA